MSQWNLSVQLTGQGTDLVNTLRRSSTQARALSRDIADARREIARLRQSARGDIRIGVRVDTSSLRRDVQAAVRGVGGQRITIPLGIDGTRLRSEVNRALNTASTGQGLTVDLHVDSSQLRREVADAVRAASDGHRIEIPIGLADPMQLRRDVAAAVRWASMGHTLTIPVTLDTRRAVTQLGQLTGNLTQSSSAAAGLRGNLVGLAGLATALVPIAASAAPLAASLVGAGAATTAFGIALAGQVGALGDAADAQTKFDEAVRDHGATSKEAAQAQQALQAQLAAMPAPTREASAALSSLKSQYQDWSDSLAGDTMPVAVHGFELLSAVIPRLTPMVKSASQQMDRLIKITAGGVASDSFDRLFSAFDDFAAGSLNKVTNEFVHLLQVLSGQAPAGSQELREFMAYARANAPAAADTLRQVASALLNLMVAAGDVGVGMLQVVNAFARLVAAIPSGVLSTLLQLYTAFKLVAVGAAALNAVTGAAAVARLTAYFAAMRTAGVGTTLRATVTSMTSMQKAALGLGVLGIAALGIGKLADEARGAPPDVDRLTTSLKNLAVTGKMTGELKDTFGSFNGLIEAMKNYKKEAKGAKEASEGNFGFRIPVLDDVASWFADRTNDIVKGGKSFSALKEDFQGVDKALAQLASSGNAKDAAAGFDIIRQAGQKAGYSTKEINKLLPDYRKTVASLKVEQQLAAAGMGLFGDQAQATSAKLEAQKASADGLRQAIQALNDVNRAGLGGMIGFEAAIDAASEAAKKNAGALSMTGGQLNLSSQKARDAASALNDLAAKTDDAAAKARESGSSWETVNGIYARGREQIIASARVMGLEKAQAESLAASILKIPSKHSTQIEMRQEDAIAGLDAVIAKIRATPNAKSVTVNALTREAIALLESLGYKVRTLPNGKVQVTALTGSAMSNLAAVLAARNALRDKSVLISVTRRTIFETVQRSGGSNQAAKNAHDTFNADGAVYYAGGGMNSQGGERHVAQIARPGTWRVWAEDETGGEAYIPLARGKRPRSRAIAEETIRRLGGDPRAIQWNADGNVLAFAGGGMDFSYSGTGGQANRYTLSGLISASNDKKGNFSLSIFTSKLRASNNALDTWRKDLATVASRAGQDVADALADMGDEGIALTRNMAHGSARYIKDMASQLRNLAASAKASLGEYTSQLNAAVKNQSAFQANLATLAGQGYGALASRLASQNDTDAEALAAAAAKDKRKASAANKAATSADNTLSSEQITQLVQIIAAVKNSKTGIHDVASATGLGEDDIVATATKARTQISRSLGSRAGRFLSDLAKAQKGLAYANGGIRPGIYGTRAGAVTFAEPATGGEAYIPLGTNKRASATRVLGDVAGRFGVGLTDAGAGQVVVIREQGPLVGTQTFHVTGTGNATDTARQVESRTGYQLRRLARGGAR